MNSATNTIATIASMTLVAEAVPLWIFDDMSQRLTVSGFNPGAPRRPAIPWLCSLKTIDHESDGGGVK